MAIGHLAIPVLASKASSSSVLLSLVPGTFSGSVVSLPAGNALIHWDTLRNSTKLQLDFHIEFLYFVLRQGIWCRKKWHHCL